MHFSVHDSLCHDWQTENWSSLDIKHDVCTAEGILFPRKLVMWLQRTANLSNFISKYCISHSTTTMEPQVPHFIHFNIQTPTLNSGLFREGESTHLKTFHHAISCWVWFPFKQNCRKIITSLTSVSVQCLQLAEYPVFFWKTFPITNLLYFCLLICPGFRVKVSRFC